MAEMTDRVLLWEAFRCEAWGPSSERSRELRDLEAIALQRPSSRDLFDLFMEARKEGVQAWRLTQELSEKMRDAGEVASQRWLDARIDGLPYRVAKHLRLRLVKEGERLRTKMQHGGRPTTGSSVRVTMADGRHPNALRLQKPSSHWYIYIDETGATFDETALDNPEDHEVGRIVALAVPAGTRLPPISGFHATDSKSEAVDQILQRVLDGQIGILGFSVLDPSARHRYWIGHVLHLVRWTLLQLPVPTGSHRCRVEIFIEQRDSYDKKTDLTVVGRALESELSTIDPDRFAELALDLSFMAKDDPMNGYVDAVAFTWGSPSKASKARLKQSGLQGHCLISADEIGLHHLYLTLSQTGALAPADWYALCSTAFADPTDGFLSRELDSLGQRIAGHPELWQSYLAEVQSRLQAKKYDLFALGHAISWLKDHAGQGRTLPGVLQLQLLSSNLTLANHRGQVDKDLVMACLNSIRDLHDEAPQLTCEALLRMTVATTNSFEFNALGELIADRLAQPVAIAGLLNYGKLQSVQGQLLAFRGAPDQSLPWFDRARASFQRLSDPAQSLREMRQTQVYRLFAEMDALRRLQGTDIGKFVGALSDFFSGRTQAEISHFLAKAAQPERFNQHLWLRAMVCFPTELADARDAYVKDRRHWLSGEDHPWALILAYRGWLLRDAGHLSEARRLFEEAIDLCLTSDHGPTLLWMAGVLRHMAAALGVDLAPELIDAEIFARLRSRLPRAPHPALATFAEEAGRAPLDRDRILDHLENCLPFNFH